MDKTDQILRGAKGSTTRRRVLFVSLAVFMSLAILMALGLMSACGPTPTPEVVEVTREVTREVTKVVEVTREVTKVVEVTRAVEPVEAMVAPTPEPFVCSGGTGPENPLVCIAQTAQVTVTVPWQQEVDRPVEVHSLPLKTLKELQSNNDQFKPRRLVINFEVKVKVNDEYETLSTFAPCMTIQTTYTRYDYCSRLVLGYWNDKAEEGEGPWIILASAEWDQQEKIWENIQKKEWENVPPEEVNVEIEGDSEGGIISATVCSWGDAHVGHGE